LEGGVSALTDTAAPAGPAGPLDRALVADQDTPRRDDEGRPDGGDLG
jgi:hypothetical protein